MKEKCVLPIQKTALSVGAFFAIIHAAWAILVGLGLGQTLANFKTNIHFIKTDFSILPFDAATGIGLIILSFVVGTIIGALFALVWNYFNSH